MTADSFLADVATQVVAWHNRHPLARRITRKDVQGIGLVELPFARDGLPAWDAPQPKRGLLSLMFAPRQRRRSWPAFSEDVVPEIGLKRLAAFAHRHGYEDRPGPPGLPERAVAFDRDLLDPPKPAAQPPERVSRFLVTAAIDIGPQRPRLMLGRGRRPAVLGQRLWSLPRLAALGGGLLVAMLASVALLWLKAMPLRSSAPAGAAASAPAPAAASKPAPKPVASPSSAPAPASAAPAVAVAAPPGVASTPASAVVMQAPRPSVPEAPHRLPPASSAPATRTGSASAASRPATSPAMPASAMMPPLPASAVSTVPPIETQRASAPLVPRLRPDLAASARAEAPGGPLRPPPGQGPAAERAPGTPGVTPPRAIGAAPTAAASATRFYALVTRPVRSKAEADALLRRLRAETDRIGHPTATQTGLLESRDGWRATWWPFTNPRQAENARVALQRRIELEVVDF